MARRVGLTFALLPAGCSAPTIDELQADPTWTEATVTGVYSVTGQGVRTGPGGFGFRSILWLRDETGAMRVCMRNHVFVIPRDIYAGTEDDPNVTARLERAPGEPPEIVAISEDGGPRRAVAPIPAVVPHFASDAPRSADGFHGGDGVPERQY